MDSQNKISSFTFQAEFLLDTATGQIAFASPVAAFLPVKEASSCLVDEFASFFIKQDRQSFSDFFNPASWSNASANFTMSTNPDEYQKGESCSVFIQQLGKDEQNRLKGQIINVSLFLPGDFLYRDLAVFVEGIGNFRKITHDLNNQFQIITGFGSALEDEMTDPDLKECATNVMDAVGKAIEQNKELRKFFPPKDKPKLFTSGIINNPTNSSNQPSNTSTVASTEKVETKGAPEAALMEGTGILVIDDEPLVQRFLCEMLKRLKYRATGCATAQDAIDAFNKDPKSFSMAIVDMHLPDMSSEELFDTLRKTSPDLKVILISGDNLGESSQRIIDKGANGFIQKPTTIKTLSESINQILLGKKFTA